MVDSLAPGERAVGMVRRLLLSKVTSSVELVSTLGMTLVPFSFADSFLFSDFIFLVVMIYSFNTYTVLREDVFIIKH